MKRDGLLGQGTFKNVYKYGSDMVLLVPKGQPDEFLRDAAKQMVIAEIFQTHYVSLDPEQRLHFARIPRIQWIGWIQGTPVVLMERVPDVLDTVMTKKRDLKTFCVCMYQLTRTIRWLHKKCKFIHGDLKMNNVGLRTLSSCPMVQAYILDFGFASFELPDVTVPPQHIYMDTSTRRAGPHGNNDILFFLVTSYTAWHDVLRYQRNSIQSALEAYVMYLVDTIFARVRRDLPGAGAVAQHYSVYNPGTAGPTFDDAVQLDVVRVILASFKADACVARILHQSSADPEDVQMLQRARDQIAQITDELARVRTDAQSKADELARVRTDAQSKADELARVRADAQSKTDELARVRADALAKLAQVQKVVDVSSLQKTLETMSFEDRKRVYESLRDDPQIVANRKQRVRAFLKKRFPPQSPDVSK